MQDIIAILLTALAGYLAMGIFFVIPFAFVGTRSGLSIDAAAIERQ
jgi:hypothetical protein